MARYNNYLYLIICLLVVGCDSKVNEDSFEKDIVEEHSDKLIIDFEIVNPKNSQPEIEIKIEDNEAFKKLEDKLEEGVNTLFDNADITLQFNKNEYNTMFINELIKNNIAHTVLKKNGKYIVKVNMKDVDSWGPIRSNIQDQYIQEVKKEFRKKNNKLLPSNNTPKRSD